MADWTPVDEALPEVGTPVLVFDLKLMGLFGTDVVVAHYCLLPNQEMGWESRLNHRVTLKPTHWMPLPLGPKEDSP